MDMRSHEICKAATKQQRNSRYIDVKTFYQSIVVTISVFDMFYFYRFGCHGHSYCLYVLEMYNSYLGKENNVLQSI